MTVVLKRVVVAEKAEVESRQTLDLAHCRLVLRYLAELVEALAESLRQALDEVRLLREKCRRDELIVDRRGRSP